MKQNYLVIGLLLVIVFLLIKQKKIQQPKKTVVVSDPITYWAPGYNSSFYYPFNFRGSFRRHHRYHGGKYRRRRN